MYWQEYLALVPPDRPASERTAALMAQITNMSGRSLPDKKMVRAKDFLDPQEPSQQAMQDQINYMKAMEHSDG